MSDADFYSSKRAFPLESRAVWVEQQIVRSCILPRDNLYIGPGEYDIRPPTSHIASPVMKAPYTADDFHPFRGNTAGSTRSYRGKQKRPYTISNDFGGLSASRVEFASVFHDHDQRMALDPSNRHYISQAPMLPPDNFMDAYLHDGNKKPAAVIMEKQKYQRPPIVLANPDANPNFNTEAVMPRQKLGVIPKAERKPVFPGYEDFSIPEREATSPVRPPSNKSTFKPKRTHKFPEPLPKIQFDASCYQKTRKPPPVALTPTYINGKAKINIFKSTLLKPRSYQSKPLDSALSQRIKRNSME
jgi:hypothetical protein